MSKGTVLVIDDEKDLIELVRYNLDKEGFDVVAAHDGSSGLEIATRHKPNLVVLDLMMPGMDGLAGSSTAKRSSTGRWAARPPSSIAPSTCTSPPSARSSERAGSRSKRSGGSGINSGTE